MRFDEVLFLEIEDVEIVHARMIAAYGGADGLRDAGLLESAVMSRRRFSRLFVGRRPLRLLLARTLSGALFRTSRQGPTPLRHALVSLRLFPTE
jgi:hypothetical protein